MGDEANRKPSEQESIPSRFSGEGRRPLRTVNPGEEVAAGIQKQNVRVSGRSVFLSQTIIYSTVPESDCAQRLTCDMTERRAVSGRASAAEGERRCRRRETIRWIVERRERADIHGSPGW